MKCGVNALANHTYSRLVRDRRRDKSWLKLVLVSGNPPQKAEYLGPLPIPEGQRQTLLRPVDLPIFRDLTRSAPQIRAEREHLLGDLRAGGGQADLVIPNLRASVEVVAAEVKTPAVD